MCTSSKCHTFFSFSVVDLVFQQFQRSTLLWLEAHWWITSRPCGTETTVVTVNSDCSSPLLVKAETRPSFLGLEGWIVDEMNGLHILMLWEKVYGMSEEETERVKKQLHQTHHLSCDSLPCDISLVLCTAVLYLCVCSRALFLYAFEGTCDMCMCVLTARSNNKNHTSTGHIFQVCLTHLKC